MDPARRHVLVRAWHGALVFLFQIYCSDVVGVQPLRMMLGWLLVRCKNLSITESHAGDYVWGTLLGVQPLLTHQIDGVLTFGGDGTVLYGSSLFPTHCPPFLSFSFGTVGFLAPFRDVDMATVLEKVRPG